MVMNKYGQSSVGMVSSCLPLPFTCSSLLPFLLSISQPFLIYSTSPCLLLATCHSVSSQVPLSHGCDSEDKRDGVEKSDLSVFKL